LLGAERNVFSAQAKFSWKEKPLGTTLFCPFVWIIRKGGYCLRKVGFGKENMLFLSLRNMLTPGK
jgi:hypothetical protein